MSLGRPERFGGPTLICARITDVEQTTSLQRRDTVGKKFCELFNILTVIL